MEKNYIASIVGAQFEAGQSDQVQLIVPCYYKKTDEETVLAYSEFDKNNADLEIKSTLTIDKNGIATLTRESSQNKSKMTFEKGKRHISGYATEYGTIMIGVYGKEIHYDLNENGGTIELNYNLDFNAEELSSHVAIIKIKKGENKNGENS